MKVLVLGGSGMLGHKVVQTLGTRFDLWATFRKNAARFAAAGLIDERRAVDGVDAMSFEGVERAIRSIAPDFVVNCIGVVKQLSEAKDPIVSITLNSLFPHRVAAVCESAGARLIHISTDCVFSGRRGMYSENDVPDAEDLYGRTKLLGETGAEHTLTIRTSIIGREMLATTGIVEWFLAQRGKSVNGFTHAIFSGLTTEALAGLIGRLIEMRTPLSGLHHVSADPISKYDLLVLLNRAFSADVMIRPSTELRIDRSLDSTRFRLATGWQPSPWSEMVAALERDPTPYDLWRTS